MRRDAVRDDAGGNRATGGGQDEHDACQASGAEPTEEEPLSQA